MHEKVIWSFCFTTVRILIFNFGPVYGVLYIENVYFWTHEYRIKCKSGDLQNYLSINSNYIVDHCDDRLLIYR